MSHETYPAILRSPPRPSYPRPRSHLTHPPRPFYRLPWPFHQILQSFWFKSYFYKNRGMRKNMGPKRYFYKNREGESKKLLSQKSWGVETWVVGAQVVTPPVLGGVRVHGKKRSLSPPSILYPKHKTQFPCLLNTTS